MVRSSHETERPQSVVSDLLREVGSGERGSTREGSGYLDTSSEVSEVRTDESSPQSSFQSLHPRL